jgi:hypothetical protein
MCVPSVCERQAEDLASQENNLGDIVLRQKTIKRWVQLFSWFAFFLSELSQISRRCVPVYMQSLWREAKPSYVAVELELRALEAQLMRLSLKKADVFVRASGARQLINLLVYYDSVFACHLTLPSSSSSSSSSLFVRVVVISLHRVPWVSSGIRQAGNFTSICCHKIINISHINALLP